MKRLVFQVLSIEITRKCNLNCAHCIKGDAEDVDIDYNVIDSLLEQTEAIINLTITGGEPTLNIDAVRYIVAKIKERKIYVRDIFLYTNGVLHSKEFVSALIECSSIGNTKLYVSEDVYHGNNKLAYPYYKKELGSSVEVVRTTWGNFPLAAGRAKDFPGAITQYLFTNHQVHMIENGVIPKCHKMIRFIEENKHEARSIDKNRIYICCALFLTADGNIVFADSWETSYVYIKEHPDIIICKLPGLIYDEIVSWNQHMPTCETALKSDLTQLKARDPERYAKECRDIFGE